MEEFVIPNDTLEEVFENREQIEISKFYERLAKPQAIAIENNQGHRRLSSKNLYKNREPVAPNSSTKMPSLFGQSIEKR